MSPRSLEQAFDNRIGRLMVSLGPLSVRKYCTYSCPFCYVHSGFESYARMSVDEIVSWVAAQPPHSYDAVYISGDTDSFARPRTQEGLELLRRLAEVGVDLLFTTRAVFREAELTQLGAISEALAARGRLLIGCVSIAQWTRPDLEPPPIASPPERLQQLARFKAAGLATVLAVRPFLPATVVPIDDYRKILESAARLEHVPDVVLGEDWYANDELERRVFGGVVLDGVPHEVGRMDFTAGANLWRIYRNEPAERLVADLSRAMGSFFSMRSGPALRHLRTVQRRPAGLAESEH